MNSTDYLPRLAVVAAIIDPAAEGPLASSARLGSEIRAKVISAAEATPTAAERALAEALQLDHQRDSRPADPAIAELLLLADEGPEASQLATRLNQAFLLPDHSRPAPSRDERRSAFADLYRSLALHQLNNQVRNKAAAALWKLILPDPRARKPYEQMRSACHRKVGRLDAWPTGSQRVVHPISTGSSR
jgi:hypothetical protein